MSIRLTVSLLWGERPLMRQLGTLSAVIMSCDGDSRSAELRPSSCEALHGLTIAQEHEKSGALSSHSCSSPSYFYSYV